MGLTLDKEQKKVKLSLKKVMKKEVPPVQVKLLTDVSGSMQMHYSKTGYMLPILQRSIALASVIDPDKVVQITAFDTKAHELGDFGVNAFETIWDQFKPNRSGFWGGTNYACAFNSVLESRTPSAGIGGFFRKLVGSGSKPQQANEPELLLFFTDGEDGGNHRQFIEAVNSVLDKNTYLLCIGAGGSEHYYSSLKKLADDRDNVGYVYFDNPSKLTDNQFYDTVLSGELGQWLEQFAK